MIWGNRIAWIEERKRVCTAVLGHKAKRVPMPRGTISEIKLFGGRLAIALNSGPSLGDAQVWLQEVDGSRRVLVRKVDPSGCPGHGIAYRYASGRTRTASVPLDLGGFAQAAGVSYWVTQHYGDCLDDGGADAPCVIDRAELRFR